MNSLFKIIPMVLLFSNAVFGASFDVPLVHAKSYLVVGVSGFKTGRDKKETGNVMSRIVGKDFEPSGAWDNLNTTNKKIYKNAYLTHFSKDSEIESVLKLLEDENGECKKDIGLIMMINSWGAKTSQKLAQKYLDKCGTLPYLSIMIEGVSKPSPFSYTKSLLSFNCVNFYQRVSELKGNAIPNCENNEIRYVDQGMDLYMAHIDAEWTGSAKGKKIIEDYLNEKYPVMFVRDQDGIDFMRGLP